MSEQEPGAQPPVSAAEIEVKVFAVRIDPTLRSQIEGLRGITGQSVNDVGVEALSDWVAKTLADEDIQRRAMADLDAEEQQIRERRAAITSILGQAATSEKGDGRSSRRAKPQPEA